MGKGGGGNARANKQSSVHIESRCIVKGRMQLLSRSDKNSQTAEAVAAAAVHLHTSLNTDKLSAPQHDTCDMHCGPVQQVSLANGKAWLFFGFFLIGFLLQRSLWIAELPDLVQLHCLSLFLACLVSRHAPQLSQVLLQPCQLALCLQLACARLHSTAMQCCLLAIGNLEGSIPAFCLNFW